MPAPTKPTENYTWATNAAYPDTTPNRVEPPSDTRERGWLPGERVPAQHLNDVLHVHGLWHEWAEDNLDELRSRIVDDEWTYPDTKARTVWIDPSLAVTSEAFGTARGWNPQGAIGGPSSESHDAIWIMDLAAHFPSGVIITQVAVLLQMGATRATESNRTRVTLRRVTHGVGAVVPSSSDVFAEVPAANNTSVQLVTLTYEETIDRATKRFRLIVEAGDDAPSAHAGDIIHGIRVTILDPGPRNG